MRVLLVHDYGTLNGGAEVMIVALRDGAVVAHGAPSEIMTTEVLEEIYGRSIPVQEVGGHRLALYYA